ncbi:MAG: hypothetical protein KJZ93_30445 [Caldilineaceae bacterium]|nr:hypothetical protein [Caldilineaceae bacterium]
MTMQAIAIPETPTDQATVSEADAHAAACVYVAAHVDAAFEVVDGAHYFSRPLGRAVWRFFLRGEHGPVGAIQVDAQTGEVIGLTDDEIRVIHEKAAILAARKQGVLPVDGQGYVLGEYARRQAAGYLGDHIGMFFNATDPLFVPGDPPRWQVTIVFKRYHLGPFTLGVMDVDAHTGEPFPLSKAQLKRIGERVDDLVAFRTSPATA